MATDVVMPQMGESIAEGTIVRWIKKVGEKVDRDEPLFEISTDKVDAEIPSPAAGVVSEIRVKDGETVPVNSVVGVIASASTSAATPSPAAPAARPDGRALHPPPAEGGPQQPSPVGAGLQAGPSIEDALRERSSPLVRKIAKEHHVDISQIHGTGIAGRVTKDDILGFLAGEEGGAAGRQEGKSGRREAVERPEG